ncbi:MAG: SUMF1/EgtB/PvdO family nonheme iron enzyme, partial [Holophagales bacterium]|nr:SUMF1/EgtB/PvdO family nonheme iron enzyme [Holophagales bacterium]
MPRRASPPSSRSAGQASAAAEAVPMMKGLPILIMLLVAAVQEPGDGRYPEMPSGRPPAIDVPNAVAAAESDMRPYRERIARVSTGGGELHLDMAPVPGGDFLMGSPESEPGRSELESPRRRVRIAPFWMATHETTWDLYRVFMFDTDRGGEEPAAAWADAVSRPTPPYRPLDFGMGVEGFPALS